MVGPAYLTDGGLGVEAEWVVTEPTGQVIRPDTLLSRWKRLAADAGVPVIGLHRGGGTPTPRPRSPRGPGSML